MSSSTSTRVAIVTGASQGLGLSIALRLAADGFDLGINDLPAKSDALNAVVARVHKLGQRCVPVLADVSIEADVKRLVETVVTDLGGLDVMVANAGIGILKPFLETTADDWDQVTAVNQRGVFFSYKYAAAQMIKQGRGGRIIGACSMVGKKAMHNLSAYVMSKFAVRGLTQVASLELAKYNIQVNAYAPGLIDTPLGRHPDDERNGGKLSTVKLLFGLTTAAPDGSAEDVASLVSYLASPEAKFITGQTIVVDGGIVLD